MKTLDRVAAEMRRTLALSGARFVHYRLQRGLEVVLERREERLRLALGRMDGHRGVQPGVCGAAGL